MDWLPHSTDFAPCDYFFVEHREGSILQQWTSLKRWYVRYVRYANFQFEKLVLSPCLCCERPTFYIHYDVIAQTSCKGQFITYFSETVLWLQRTCFETFVSHFYGSQNKYTTCFNLLPISVSSCLILKRVLWEAFCVYRVKCKVTQKQIARQLRNRTLPISNLDLLNCFWLHFTVGCK